MSPSVETNHCWDGEDSLHGTSHIGFYEVVPIRIGMVLHTAYQILLAVLGGSDIGVPSDTDAKTRLRTAANVVHQPYGIQSLAGHPPWIELH